MNPVRTLRWDRMRVNIYGSAVDLGLAAADDLREILCSTIRELGEASIVVATGNSQLTLMEALRSERHVAWDKVSVFHLDEYVGMTDQHPASFRRYIREQLTDVIQPQSFYGIKGDAEDLEAELARYDSLLKGHKPVASVIGIGENGHLAFNDPPADLYTNKTVHIVRLAEQSRRQQVAEGHFATLSQVPDQAVTLTIPALLSPRHVLAVVPEARKAPAVKAALTGPVTPQCPASILRTLDHVTLYIDTDSASLLDLAP